MDAIRSCTGRLLIEIGEDPEREGLVKTPARAAEAMRFLTGATGRT